MEDAQEGGGLVTSASAGILTSVLIGFKFFLLLDNREDNRRIQFTKITKLKLFRNVCQTPGCGAGGRGSHVAWLCLPRSLIASSPIWDTNGDIRTLHTGHPVIGTFT